MKWIYKENHFESVAFNWEDFKYDNIPNKAVKRLFNGSYEPLVYVPQWNRCYWLAGLRYGGNGNRLKAYLIDPYNDKHYYKEAEGLELVIKV